MNHQGIRFAMFDFRTSTAAGAIGAGPIGGGSDIMIYKISADALLKVAFEGATGVFTTYNYKLKKGDIVYVYNNVIHVPQRCVKQEPGNTIKCDD